MSRTIHVFGTKKVKASFTTFIQTNISTLSSFEFNKKEFGETNILLVDALNQGAGLPGLPAPNESTFMLVILNAGKVVAEKSLLIEGIKTSLESSLNLSKTGDFLFSFGDHVYSLDDESAVARLKSMLGITEQAAVAPPSPSSATVASAATAYASPPAPPSDSGVDAGSSYRSSTPPPAYVPPSEPHNISAPDTAGGSDEHALFSPLPESAPGSAEHKAAASDASQEPPPQSATSTKVTSSTRNFFGWPRFGLSVTTTTSLTTTEQATAAPAAASTEPKPELMAPAYSASEYKTSLTTYIDTQVSREKLKGSPKANALSALRDQIDDAGEIAQLKDIVKGVRELVSQHRDPLSRMFALIAPYPTSRRELNKVFNAKDELLAPLHPRDFISVGDDAHTDADHAVVTTLGNSWS